MGYDTEFEGSFKLSRRVTPDEFDYMRRFNFTRHEAFDVDKLIAEFGDSRGLKGLGYGERGEYYVSAIDGHCARENACIVRGGYMYRPRHYQYGDEKEISPNCHWKLTDDGMRLVWDGGEKTYDYIEWLDVTIGIFEHWGITLSGSVNWHGDDDDDDGNITVLENRIVKTDGYLAQTDWGKSEWDWSQRVFNEYELQRKDNNYKWEEHFPALAAHLDEMCTIPACLLASDASRYQTYYELMKEDRWAADFRCKFMPPGFIPEFKLSAKPVTVAVWNEYCQWLRSDDIRMDDPNLPITNVFWTELLPSPYEDEKFAFDFCNWVFLITGCKVTLPTITQFQYALRAGDTRSFVYPWGLNGLVRFPDTLAPVDRSDLVYCNSLGLSDMVGNIEHWCFEHNDWEYSWSPNFFVKCGVGDQSNSWAWLNCAFDVRCSDDDLSRTGFRLCSNPENPNGTFEDVSTMCGHDQPTSSETLITSQSDWKVIFPCLADYISRICPIPGKSFVMGIPIEETVWVDELDWERYIIDDERITKRVSLYRDAHPAHNVTLSNYSIGEYPVTVAMWREYCTATGREMPPKPTWGWVDDYPIQVTWHDAMGPFSIGGFCGWASQVSGYALTLPTEAQFDFASSGGEEGVLFPWGNEFSDKLLWCSNRKQRVAPGGVNRTSNIYRNAFGLIDVCGNICQWCLDGYGPYGDSDAINPVRPAENNLRVVRSSSYDVIDPLYMRRCYRSSGNIYKKFHGFRMVINIP